MSDSTLILLKKLIADIPPNYGKSVLKKGAEVVLIQDGVYNRLEEVARLAPDIPGIENWRVLDEDLTARNLTSDFERVSYDYIVTAIKKHGKVITL